MDQYAGFAGIYEQWSAEMSEDGENRCDITLDSGGSISVWWATKNEWLGLVDVSGLEVEALYGWFDKRPFDDESREYVWVARKPA